MPTTKQEFEKFDAKHPEVYTIFKRFVYELRDAGIQKVRADEVLHRVRWEILTTDVIGGRIDVPVLFGNRYAIKFMTENEVYRGFFDLTVTLVDTFNTDEENKDGSREK